MHKNYSLVKLKNNYYDFLVVAKSCDNPLDFMDEILGKTNKENLKIIFDFTPVEDYPYDQYVEYDDSKSENLFDCFRFLKNIDQSIKALCYNYL